MTGLRNVVASILLILLSAFGLACRSSADADGSDSAGEVAPVAVNVPGEAAPVDPYLWLEDIDAPQALAWVREQNERTRRELASTPLFDEMYRNALAALNSRTRVPSLQWKGDFLYNLWKSPENPRGVLRRTTLADLRRGEPRWTTVLDVDALSEREGTKWVYKNLRCLPPESRLCLMSLSPGGGDAVEIREFDATTLRFVEDGFFIPEAKSNVSWIDEDTLFVGTDFGAGSMTESGYPRVVKVWRRGTPLEAARTLYEGAPTSVSVSAFRYRTPAGDIDVLSESTTFWESDYYQVIDPLGPEPTLRRIEIPPTSVISGAFHGRLVVSVLEPWTVAGRTIRSGSVALVDPSGERAVEVLVEPSASEVVEAIEVTDETILVTMLDNVRARLYRFTPAEAPGAAVRIHLVPPGGRAPEQHRWSRSQIAFPDNGAISVMTVKDESGDALALFESFVEPPTLFYVAGPDAAAGTARPEALLAQEATFDGSRFEVTQQWAVSADGTRIPYFVVAPRGMVRDGRNSTHIFSYGGFRNSLTPSYSGSYEQLYGTYGKNWLERGGVFVLANIRGGGEFGPEWHASVLKENRYKVFEDFEAVAEDLVRTGITSRGRIGIEGRSNGGLLTLATMVRRPELYGAVISGVPLADMKRYHELLAGASWMAEYGDPDIPAEWAFLGSYSPYQNLDPEADYPPVFVFTSTRDDRVHPGHARKTVAKLLDQGHEVWYYENLEGGHGGSSTNEQLAYRVALSYAHLWRSLGGVARSE